jgi:hypothetical protein
MSDSTATDLPYTVIVSGQRFTLTRQQITFDSPNHFTNAFLGDFSESSTRTLHLDGSPELFAIIVDYLRGYDILPLEPRSLPRTMGPEKAKINLGRDAEHLGLNKLAALLGPLGMRSKLPRDLEAQLIIDIEDVVGERLPPGISWAGKEALKWSNSLHLVTNHEDLAIVRASSWADGNIVILSCEAKSFFPAHQSL